MDAFSLNKIIADNVKNLRKQKGVSQEKAKDECGVNFSRIECALYSTNTVTITHLSNYFKIPPHHFLIENSNN